MSCDDCNRITREANLMLCASRKSTRALENTRAALVARRADFDGLLRHSRHLYVLIVVLLINLVGLLVIR